MIPNYDYDYDYELIYKQDNTKVNCIETLIVIYNYTHKDFYMGYFDSSKYDKIPEDRLIRLPHNLKELSYLKPYIRKFRLNKILKNIQ